MNDEIAFPKISGSTRTESRDIQVLTISELSFRIKDLLETQFGNEPFWIEGEVSNFKGRNYSGHMYFNLKDESSVLPVVYFKNANTHFKAPLKDGLMVQAVGRISLYPPHGRYQFIIEKLKLKGKGDLHERFEKLKETLQKKGYFDMDRKKKLPPVPSRIGIITSPTGAVIRDIINGLTYRFPHVHAIIFPVKVQGNGAAQEIASAIRAFNKGPYDVDLIILARGGGSIEDLWPFNEEIVADAIHHSTLPVVSAVGHMTDFTISDFVADVRAATPSNAVELIVPEIKDLRKSISEMVAAIQKTVHREIQFNRERFATLLRRRIIQNPMEIVVTRHTAVNDLSERLAPALTRHVSRMGEALAMRSSRLAPGLAKLTTQKRHDLARTEERVHTTITTHIHTLRSAFAIRRAKLSSMSPYKVLDRGYSISQDQSGAVVTDATMVLPGESLTVRLHKGYLDTIIKDTHVPRPKHTKKAR